MSQHQKPKTLSEALDNLATALAEYVNELVNTALPLLTDLVKKGYMTPDGKLTAKGKKLLNKGGDERLGNDQRHNRT